MKTLDMVSDVIRGDVTPATINHRSMIVKKIMTALGMAFCGVMSALAEGTPVIDTTTAASAVNQIKTDLGSWVTTVTPYLLGVAGAFLVFWLVKFAIRIIKGFVGSSK